MEAVAGRTSAKIRSFKLRQRNSNCPGFARAWQKKRLEKIVRRTRDSSIGRAGYSGIDFLEDVKCACAREGLPFDNDLFNELVSYS